MGRRLIWWKKEFVESYLAMESTVNPEVLVLADEGIPEYVKSLLTGVGETPPR